MYFILSMLPLPCLEKIRLALTYSNIMDNISNASYISCKLYCILLHGLTFQNSTIQHQEWCLTI